MIEYRRITDDVPADWLADFDRRQVVDWVWRKRDGEYTLVREPFVDDWSAGTRRSICEEDLGPAARTGFLAAAFDGGRLVGFAALAGAPIGSRRQYLDLLVLHVSAAQRRQGIGRTLFAMAADFGRAVGAEALYISAHSAKESAAFYHSMGCIPAREPQAAHLAAEPYDLQLEFPLFAGK